MLKRIPGVGSYNPQIMIVGEAPGGEEELQGKPFVGAAGYELSRLMASVGISRADCFITNVCKYRPAMNDIETWVRKKPDTNQPWVEFNGKFVATPVMEGIRELEEDIKIRKPNVVVALGNTPLWALTGKGGISDRRGSIMESTLVSGVKVIPTYHPAFVLRSYSDRYDLAADLHRVKQESLSPKIQVPDWQFHLRPTLDQVLQYLANLGTHAIVDIETRSGQITCIGVGKSLTEAMCIPISSRERGGSYWSEEEEFLVMSAVNRELKQRKVVNQNFLYDAFYLSSLYGIRITPVFDTMIAMGVSLPGRPKSLDYLASLFCKYYSYWKHDKKDWTGYVNDNELWFYNCQDCVYTWEVWHELDKLIDQRGVRKQFEFEMKLFEPVHQMMVRGVNSTEEKKLEFSGRLAKSIYTRREKLAEIFGHDVNPNSPQQLIKLFYQDLKQPVVNNRKTKTPTTDNDAMDKIGSREPLLRPICEMISETRTFRLTKSNFVDCLTPMGRYFCGYNPVGTVTFRFNSSANPMGWGTNLQNVPKIEEDDLPSYYLEYPNVRELFLPDPGYTLAEFDLSKADLRVVVWESDEPLLKQALINGENIYKKYGTEVTGMPYRTAKSFIHGTDYGGKPRTMAINCGISEAAAKIAQAKWFNAFPGIHRWQKRVAETLFSTHTVENRFGFKITYFDRVDSVVPEALAWGPQSTVAIIINTVLRRVYDRWEARGDQVVQLLMQVHDSFVCQIKNEFLADCVEEIFSFFDQVVVPFPDPLIIPADCKISTTSWAEMKKYDRQKTRQLA